jgi:hypothetical protein
MTWTLMDGASVTWTCDLARGHEGPHVSRGEGTPGTKAGEVAAPGPRHEMRWT